MLSSTCNGDGRQKKFFVVCLQPFTQGGGHKGFTPRGQHGHHAGVQQVALRNNFSQNQYPAAAWCRARFAAARAGPAGLAGSVAATGDAPLQKADVITYDTSLLREETETTYATPSTAATALLNQRRRYSDQLLLLLPNLNSWMQFTAATLRLGSVSLQRG